MKRPSFSYLFKKCPHCKKILKRDFFGLSKARPGGLKSLCRKCSYMCKDFAKVIVNAALREKRTKNATPKWINKKDLERVHRKRIDLQEKLNIKLSVDHIIPINHLKVSGLNIPNNLHITTQSFNASKSNKISLKDISSLLKDSKIIDGIRFHNSVLKHILE